MINVARCLFAGYAIHKVQRTEKSWVVGSILTFRFQLDSYKERSSQGSYFSLISSYLGLFSSNKKFFSSSDAQNNDETSIFKSSFYEEIQRKELFFFSFSLSRRIAQDEGLTVTTEGMDKLFFNKLRQKMKDFREPTSFFPLSFHFQHVSSLAWHTNFHRIQLFSFPEMTIKPTST